jgi:hypothetical protein
MISSGGGSAFSRLARHFLKFVPSLCTGMIAEMVGLLESGIMGYIY